MARDIDIKCDDGKFKFRVAGIVKVDNKYLGVGIETNQFWCFPGGHVELGEDTDHAICREMREEVGYDIKIEKLILIHQNFFKDDRLNGKTYHELCYYYIVSPVNKKVEAKDYVVVENDKGVMKTLHFKWFTAEEIEKEDFRPNDIKKLLKNPPQEAINMIFRENC